MIAPAKPVWVYLQQVVEGEVKKSAAKSADAETGGGARDIRMPELYGRFLAQQVFKVEPNADGVYEKTLHCMFLGKAIGIPLALHPPNASRGSEWRIGRMNTFPPWKLDMVEFKQRTHEWFYVIVLDENGNVWGALARNGFADDVPSIRQFATKLLGLGRKQARGAVNLKTGAEVV